MEANADAVAGAAIYRVYANPAGTSGPPVLVASSATLPTSFTATPGDTEFTIAAGDADGESAPSAVVLLTVV